MSGDNCSAFVCVAFDASCIRMNGSTLEKSDRSVGRPLAPLPQCLGGLIGAVSSAVALRLRADNSTDIGD